MQYLAVAAGGALGAVLRVGLSQWCARHWAGFAWGTFVANLLGCLLFGLVMGWLTQRPALDAWRLPLLGGFLGAFTTFSAFAYDNVALMDRGAFAALGFNVVAQNLGGIVLVFLGLALARL